MSKRKADKVDASEGSLWSAIPHDILYLLCQKLGFFEDFVRFFAVCRSWYSFGSLHYKKLEFAPLFMLREDPHSSTTERTLRNHLSGNDFVLHLPEAAGRRCWGSPFGWIVTFRAADLELTLLNPFSRASIALPSLLTLIPGAADYNPNQRLIKAILTASPDSVDCLVVLMIRPSASEASSIVGFARPGQCRGWSQFEGCPGDLSDVVWFQGSLYGCRRNSLELVLIEPPRAVEFAVLPQDLAREQLFRCAWDQVAEWSEFKSMQYVVDWGGNLCLVLRYVNDNTTYHFKMFRVDLATKKWTRVWPSIGDQCLFIGNNYSFAYTCSEAVASASASSNHFKANWIYYTNDDDLSAKGPNEGIFNTLKCRAVEVTLKDFNLNPSLWVTPRLHFPRLDMSKNKNKNKVQRCGHSGIQDDNCIIN